MKRSTVVCRALGSLCAVFVAVAGMVTFNAAPAQADYKYSYYDVCGDAYRVQDSFRLYTNTGVYLGGVSVGISDDYSPRRVCVATRKYTWHGTPTHMVAYVRNVSTQRSHWDAGDFTEYAGENCVHRATGCSAINVQYGDVIRINGEIGNRSTGDHEYRVTTNSNGIIVLERR